MGKKLSKTKKKSISKNYDSNNLPQNEQNIQNVQNVQNEQNTITETSTNEKEEEIEIPGINLLNKQKHSSIEDDAIESIYIYPNTKSTLIIATRKGYIKTIKDITNSQNSKSNQNITQINFFNNRIYSAILLNPEKHENKNILLIGFEDKLGLLELISPEKGNEPQLINCKGNGLINCLLELKNNNIISAGSNIISLWKNESNNFKKLSSINIEGNSRIINLVKFDFNNTLIATQENTHKIYLIKLENENLSLIATIDKIPSIWYSNSAQKLSEKYLLLVGKFELNVIDVNNGKIDSRYIGCDRGTLLNVTEKNDGNDIWVITDFMGKSFEIFLQEGNDLIFKNKYNLNDSRKFGWGHKLVKISDKIFATANHYGEICVYELTDNYE